MKTFFERFHQKYTIDRKTGCWMWRGAKGRGYGVITHERILKTAHRIYYELTVGPIPEGLELDHVCKRSLCVNPAHLEPVTHSENCKRGRHSEIIRARAAEVTHCPQGHPYAGENLYVKPNGRRECRQCVRDAGERYRKSIGTSGKKPRKSSLGSYERSAEIVKRIPWNKK